MKNKSIKYSKGFTLVESLVAIAILSLSIAATFTAVQTGLRTSITAKNQIEAFYLAQEAVEYVKNIRDENALKSLDGSAVGWLNGLVGSGAPCDFGQICRIDSGASTVVNCGVVAGSCPYLNQNTTSGLLGYTSGAGWVATNFKREIQFTSVVPSNSEEVYMTVTVSWGSGITAKSFQVSQSLYKQQ